MDDVVGAGRNSVPRSDSWFIEKKPRRRFFEMGLGTAWVMGGFWAGGSGGGRGVGGLDRVVGLGVMGCWYVRRDREGVLRGGVVVAICFWKIT